ncbi:hypothetical protein JYT44_00305 [Caldithrix abyssi]|nr:hypothetical protein [Caldithrix abyssi]
MNDCCLIPDTRPKQKKMVCPSCEQVGKPVRALTIKALIRKAGPHYGQITDGYLCTNPNDSTVYFFAEQDGTIDKEDLLVRVGIKETEEPIYVCYCFHHTKINIEKDFIENGHSTIEASIQNEVKNKRCFCETSNPSGKCCLGAIRAVLKAVPATS